MSNENPLNVMPKPTVKSEVGRSTTDVARSVLRFPSTSNSTEADLLHQS